MSIHENVGDMIAIALEPSPFDTTWEAVRVHVPMLAPFHVQLMAPSAWKSFLCFTTIYQLKPQFNCAAANVIFQQALRLILIGFFERLQ